MKKSQDNVILTIMKVMEGVLSRPNFGAHSFTRSLNLSSSDCIKFIHDNHAYFVSFVIYDDKLGQRCKMFVKTLNDGLFTEFFFFRFPLPNFGKIKQPMLALGRKLVHRPIQEVMES